MEANEANITPAKPEQASEKDDNNIGAERDDLTKAQEAAMDLFIQIEERLETLGNVADELIENSAVTPCDWTFAGSLGRIKSQLDELLEGFQTKK